MSPRHGLSRRTHLLIRAYTGRAQLVYLKLPDGRLVPAFL